MCQRRDVDLYCSLKLSPKLQFCNSNVTIQLQNCNFTIARYIFSIKNSNFVIGSLHSNYKIAVYLTALISSRNSHLSSTHSLLVDTNSSKCPLRIPGSVEIFQSTFYHRMDTKIAGAEHDKIPFEL